MFDIYASYRTTGSHDVRTAARLLARFHFVEAQLMRVASGKLASLPAWEVKCLLGRHLWQDSLHADALLRRMVELRWPRTAPLDPGPAVRDVLALLDESPDQISFLVSVYRVVKPRLVGAYGQYASAGMSLADEPSLVTIRQVIAEEQEHLREGEAMLLSLAGTYDLPAVLAWQSRLEEALTAVGDLARFPEDVGRELASHFEGQVIHPAPSRAVRDDRFHFADEEAFDERPENVDKVIAHRDADNEMHAAEVLGRTIYENPDLPWDFHVDMARQLYDEVRHAVLYQRYLEELGGKLGNYPVVPGNYAYRIALDLPHRMYDLHLRGERLGMPDLVRYREQALRHGDLTYAQINDYVHADEVPHVKNGRWLRWLLKDDEAAFQMVEQETMDIRAEYERTHPDDPIVQRYAGLARSGSPRQGGRVHGNA